MNNLTDQELNRRIIELSRAISCLFDSAPTSGDVAALRKEALYAVSEQSDIARRKLSEPSIR